MKTSRKRCPLSTPSASVVWEYRAVRHLKKSDKKAPPSPKPSFAETLRKTAEPSSSGPMTHQRIVVRPTSLEMEIRRKKSNLHPAPSELEAECTKKKLKVASFMVSPPPIVASQVANLPTPTPLVPASKDMEKAPAAPQVCKSLRFPTGKKLLVGCMHAAHALDTR